MKTSAAAETLSETRNSEPTYKNPNPQLHRFSVQILLLLLLLLLRTSIL